MLDQQQRPDAATHPGHRRVKPREGPRERLELPGILQRIHPAKICHNTMAHLAVLVTVPLDQLQVPVLATRSLDFGFFDEQVATTLDAQPDRTTASIDPELPQHAPPRNDRNTPKTPTPPRNPAELPTLNRGKWG